jgi:hypothetical protein
VRSLVVATVVVVAASACTPCRRIETTPIALDCAQRAAFSGELHFDSAGSFRSFLSDRCLLDSSDDEIDGFVDDIDFSKDAVFVARGARAGSLRCIQERDAESVDVCDDGLHIAFADEESADASCGGSWTVAFVLPREELRAAIDDDDAATTFE